MSVRNKKPNRTGRTEPNRTVYSEPEGTVHFQETNRSEPRDKAIN